MATDIKLDQQGGNWVVIEGAVLKCAGSDLMLDSAQRRSPGSGPLRRALVHDASDGLTLNFARDYPGGVTVEGGLAVTRDLAVTGEVTVGGVRVARDSQLQALQERIDEQQETIRALADLIGAVIVPAWRTKEEVEEGDDMGLVSPPASELGLVVEYEFDQLNPLFGHEDVISISPPPGTPVLRGSTVRVRINLQG